MGARDSKTDPSLETGRQRSPTTSTTISSLASTLQAVYTEAMGEWGCGLFNTDILSEGTSYQVEEIPPSPQ